jgi:hypothetical protein
VKKVYDDDHHHHVGTSLVVGEEYGTSMDGLENLDVLKI